MSGRFFSPLRALRRLGVACLSLGLLLPLTLHAAAPNAPAPLRAVIVSGGPDLNNNQVAIESNVRYLNRLLPSDTVRTILFADGNPNHSSVLYDDDFSKLPVGERVLRLLLKGRAALEDTAGHYRKPELGGKLDGASKNADLNRVFQQLSQEYAGKTERSLLLYFTGHGSSNRDNLDNNMYDLWGESLSVRELAKQISKLPRQVPVTLIMVQCFSGAFGNLIFEDADPRSDLTDRDIAGFFATVPNRVAAGCTSEVNEAEYHDFTSYFFAALTGRDRVGRSVSGADYNNDGRVGMDEAFYYTLANDRSIDVPVCTSDVFLRRFVPLKDSEVFRTPFSTVQTWANPAQRAALDALAEKVHLSGEKRLATAYDRLFHDDSGFPQRERGQERELSRRFETAREEGRLALFRRWPDLRLSDARASRTAREEAMQVLAQQANEGRWNELLDTEAALEKTENESETKDIAESYMLRFVRLGKSIILAHRLNEKSDPTIKARYARLLQAEGRTLLPPADSLQQASR